MAVQLDIRLGRLPCRLGDGLALGDQDLGLYDVDAGDFLGHGVFNLNPRIYLDKIELTVVHIHEEFDGARTFIVHMSADFSAQFANLGTLFVAEVGGGCAFDNLLVAALNRTISFK